MKKQYMNEFTRDFLQSREKPRVTENRNIEWWLARASQRFETGFVLCLIAFMICLFAFLINNQRGSAFFPLTEIQLMGEPNFTNEQDIEGVLREVLPKSLLDTDTHAIKRAIMTLPWVTHVDVSKHWPGILKVKVVERNPVMRWGENQVVDAEGVVFKASNNLKIMTPLMNKPMLIGPEEKALTILQNFTTFADAFPDYHRIGVKSFILTSHQSWELGLKSGTTVKFGDKFLIPRVKRLAYAFKNKILPNISELDVIFLTYNQGFSVRWKAGKNPDGSDAQSKLIPVKLESI